MSEKQKTYLKAAGIVAVLVFIWWWLRKPGAVQQAVQQQAANPWSGPFLQTNPGINDQMTWLMSQPPQFNAQNTLNYYNGEISGLSRQYIPMFGLVGMTAVSA
jgi:hypothetical protein